MKLYEISEAMKDIERMIEEGVPADQLIDSLKDMQEDFELKAKDILFVHANMAGDIEKLKVEESRLKERRQVAERQKARLEDYLRENMTSADMTEINNGVLTAKIGKPRPMVEIVDEDLIPDQYRAIKTTVSIDKKELLKAVKEGDVEGAALGYSKPSLTIK